MTTKIPEECRRQISLFLPDAIHAALTSYQEYVTTPGQEAVGKFRDYHVSCKAAAAHLELLLKLAKMTSLPDAGLPDQDRQAMAAGAVRKAGEELDGYREKLAAQDKKNIDINVLPC